MRWALWILLPAWAYADGPDPETLNGMDAELCGDWAQAIESYGRAVEKNPIGITRLHLRNAKSRGAAAMSERMNQLIKGKHWAEVALATALAREVSPKGRTARRGQSALKRAKVAVPDALDEGVAALPSRSPRGRASYLLRYGGMGARAEGIKRGCLEFLVRTQEEDGRWDADKHGGKAYYDIGVTALALMAFLVDGPEALKGPHKIAIQKAVDYLKSVRSKHGFGPPASQHFMYMVAFATEAMAEYAVIAGKAKELEDELENARDFLQRARNRDLAWRYDPRGGENDTSVTCCVVEALHALQLAGLEIDQDAWKGALAWVNKVTDPEFGQTGYVQRGGQSARPGGMQDKYPAEQSQAMTAAGCVVRAYTGGKLTSGSLARIEKVPPSLRYADFYYWVLGARAFQARTGAIPAAWYEPLVEVVGKLVESDGGIRVTGPWGPDGGRIYTTAMCVLAMACPYREPGPRHGHGWTMSEFRRNRLRSVTVLAKPGIARTGIYIDPSAALSVRTFGIIRPGRYLSTVRASGMKTAPGGARRIVKKAPYYCLVGRVGLKGKPFRIVEDKPITTKEAGELYLLTNTKDRATASGFWNIEIRPSE
ncbi:MAG: terpene cyclase/mutase family protein [Planctomycetota bacterium]|nr:terpene cyclase/mutase family protein [Planctomycetota bacterium]